MGLFTIKFNNLSHTFTTNLSETNAKLFSHWGTNLKGSTVTANSITVSNKEDYNFVLKAFTDLAKGDGNAENITDADIGKMNRSQLNCGNPKIKQNIWHSHDKGEYNYHTEKPNNMGVAKTIWLSNHEDEGV